MVQEGLEGATMIIKILQWNQWHSPIFCSKGTTGTTNFSSPDRAVLFETIYHGRGWIRGYTAVAIVESLLHPVWLLYIKIGSS